MSLGPKKATIPGENPGQLWTVGYVIFAVVSFLFIIWLFFYLPYIEAIETAANQNYHELPKK